jgi:DNA-directed RNA polymerase specialized sigma24 family protein
MPEKVEMESPPALVALPRPVEVGRMPKNRRDPDSSIREPEAELADRVTHRLRSALLVLSPLERAILALHNGFAFSHAEVAEILGIEESQVASVVHELRPRLREMGPLIGKEPGQGLDAADRHDDPEGSEDDSRPPA